MAAPKTCSDVPIPDDDLVARVRAGDEAAFEALYERYFPRVYAFLNRRLSNHADTEEVVQEVFINLFSSIEGYRGEAPFAAWVFGLTRRTLAHRFKKKQHATIPFGEDEMDHAGAVDPLTVRREPDPYETYEYHERLLRMESAAKSLSDQQWRLFEWHHLQNYSIHEISRRLRKSEDAVKSHLYRARKALLAR